MMKVIALSVLDQVLASTGTLASGQIATWASRDGVLSDGRAVRLSTSCLLQPQADDVVWLWVGEETTWVLSILQRAADQAPLVLATDRQMTIQAPKLGIVAGTFQIQATDFFSQTKNHHSIAQTHTEEVNVRLAQIGTDIRRADRATDTIKAGLIQRAGTWVSITLNQVRQKARTFMFD